MVEVFYSDGNEDTMGGKKYNDVMLILDVYEPTDLGAFVASQTPGPYFTTLFHQGAQAVKFLHDCSIIHRDLKLANFLVRIRPKPHIYLTDFGHSILLKDTRSNVKAREDHQKGTISYLPPEILALKATEAQKGSWDRPGAWDFASDVFAYGIVGFKMFYKESDKDWPMIDRRAHEALTVVLKKDATDISDLLLEMVVSDPVERITMRDLLLKSFWPEPVTPLRSYKRKVF